MVRPFGAGAGWASKEEGSMIVSAGETARDGEEAMGGLEGRAMGDGRLYADKVVMRWDLRKWGENAANL